MLRFSTVERLQIMKFRRARTCTTLALLTFLLLVSGCGMLDEREAAEVLKRSDAGRPKEVFVDLGFLNSRCGQSPQTGKYAVLERAGVIKIKSTGQSREAFTTRRGDQVFSEIGAKPVELGNFVQVTGQSRCNVRTWAVPLAEREVTGVKIVDTGNQTYSVVYTWKWKPNALGEAFHVNGPVYKRLNARQQESLNDGELPLDNRYPHVTKLQVRRVDGLWRVID